MMSPIVLFLLHSSLITAQPQVKPMTLDADVLRAMRAEQPEVQLHGLLGMAYVFPDANNLWTTSVVVRVPNYSGTAEKGYFLAIAAFDGKGEILDATQFDLPPGAINQPLLLYEILQTKAPITKAVWYLRNNDTKAYTVQSYSDLPQEGKLSSLLLTPGLAGTLAPLNHNRGEAGESRQALDPLVINDGLFPLFPATGYNAPETLYLFFTMSGTGDETTNVTFDLEIKDGDDTFAAPLFQIEQLPDLQPGRTRYFGNFDTLGFTSGTYTAILTVTSKDSGKSHQRRQDFEIVWQ